MEGWEYEQRARKKRHNDAADKASCSPTKSPDDCRSMQKKIRSLCITFFYLSNEIFTMSEKTFYRAFNTKKMLLQKNFFCHKKSLSLHHQVYL